MSQSLGTVAATLTHPHQAAVSGLAGRPIFQDVQRPAELRDLYSFKGVGVTHCFPAVISKLAGEESCCPRAPVPSATGDEGLKEW